MLVSMLPAILSIVDVELVRVGGGDGGGGKIIELAVAMLPAEQSCRSKPCVKYVQSEWASRFPETEHHAQQWCVLRTALSHIGDIPYEWNCPSIGPFWKRCRVFEDQINQA